MTEWQPEYKPYLDLSTKESRPIPTWTTVSIQTDVKELARKNKGKKSFSAYFEWLMTKDEKTDLIVENTKKIDKNTKDIEEIKKIIEQRSGEY